MVVYLCSCVGKKKGGAWADFAPTCCDEESLTVSIRGQGEEVYEEEVVYLQQNTVPGSWFIERRGRVLHLSSLPLVFISSQIFASFTVGRQSIK